MLFSKEKINSGRQTEVDLSRGFTALLIIICHVGFYLGDPSDQALFTFSDIIGSEFGAPVFMSLMGLSIVYSKHQDPKSLLMRGINLFVSGYLLSFFRTLIPLFLLGNIDEWTDFSAFFVVDILQFAGLSLMLFAFFKKIKLPSWGMLLVSLFMVGIAQFLMDLPGPLITNQWLVYFLNLFFPFSDWSCFPLLIWFFFPAFGLCLGEILIRCSNKNKFYGILLPLSLCAVIYVYFQLYLLSPNYTDYYYGHNFYYMGIKNVLINALFITFSLSFWHFSNKILPNFIRKFLLFLSSRLNIFYVFTWIYVSALIHVIAYFGITFNLIHIIGLMVFLLLLCVVSTKVFESLRNKVVKK